MLSLLYFCYNKETDRSNHVIIVFFLKKKSHKWTDLA